MLRQFSFHRQVAIPFAIAAHIFRDEPAVLLGLARDAARKLAEAPGVARHVMATTLTPDVEHDVEIILGPTRDVDRRAIMVPLTWAVVDGMRWFPEVNGEIEITDLNDNTPWCDVTFFGSYAPKFGMLGAAIDLAATHGIVEASLQHFLDLACDHLLATAAAEAKSTI